MLLLSAVFLEVLKRCAAIRQDPTHANLILINVNKRNISNEGHVWTMPRLTGFGVCVMGSSSSPPLFAAGTLSMFEAP